MTPPETATMTDSFYWCGVYNRRHDCRLGSGLRNCVRGEQLRQNQDKKARCQGKIPDLVKFLSLVVVTRVLCDRPVRCSYELGAFSEHLGAIEFLPKMIRARLVTVLNCDSDFLREFSVTHRLEIISKTHSACLQSLQPDKKGERKKQECQRLQKRTIPSYHNRFIRLNSVSGDCACYGCDEVIELVLIICCLRKERRTLFLSHRRRLALQASVPI